jgi:hypothetical protein
MDKCAEDELSYCPCPMDVPVKNGIPSKNSMFDSTNLRTSGKKPLTAMPKGFAAVSAFDTIF